MKRLKANQLGPFCSWCEPKTSRAVYRQDGFAGKFACAFHAAALEDLEAEERQRDERITEADRQTWMRLSG